ncbi:con80 domain of katanin-domain-containing protein [Globomyces pollinis-pini]|nr:con80 domain of katanin-domain-containing protein [Globomyces pollinis-pini]
MKNLDISSIEDTRDNDSNKRHAVSTVNDTQYQQPQKGFHYIPRCDGNRVLNLDLSNFIKQMPGRIQPSMMMSPTDTAMPNSDVEVLDALTFRHTSLINIFQTKLNNIRSVKEVWDEDNIRPSIEVLASLRDSSVLADILKIIVCKPKLLSLDMAQLLLPLVSELLFEIFEDYIVIACQTITLLCKSFSNLILSTLSIAENRNSVDLNLQERVNKCTLCRDEFVNSKSILVEMNTKGSLSLIVQETISELAVFQ